MSKKPKTVALTANRLSDGEVIFFTEDHTWSASIDHALAADTPDAQSILEEQGRIAEAGSLITDQYLFEVEKIGSHLRPAHIRERIRTLGPSVRVDLGKQTASGISGNFDALGAARI